MNAHNLRALRVKGPKRILVGLVLAVTVMLPGWTLFAAGPVAVDLGSTAHFAILAGAAISSTGGGTITGDVGASPIAGSAIGVTQAQVNGTIYATDGSGPAGSVVDPVLLTAAKGDLTIAYNAAAGRTPIPTGPFLDPNGGNIGTLNLVPGLYKFTSTASITGADVTLTGGPDDVWIFQIAADLQVGSGMKVALAGGARAQNVFWQVGTSAVLGTSSVFKGTILADQSITMGTSSKMEGRALAFTAGVTFDGASGSLPTTNSAPVAFPDAYATAQDTTLTLTAPGVLTNDSGTSLTAILVTGPTSGTLALNANGSFVYMPTAGFQGGDSFTYKANNGTTDSNVTTVSLTVHGANTPPVAASDVYTTAEDTTLTLTAPGVLANDFDADGDTLSAIKVTDPAHGALTLNANGSFTYVPAVSYVGSDSFNYKANDGAADSNVVTVGLTVNAVVNAVPVAVPDAYTTPEDTTLTVPAPGVLANDSGTSLTAIPVTDPAHGALTLNANGSFIYVPAANFNGGDSFTYKANDGAADSNVTTVTLTVNAVNDAPVAASDAYSTSENTMLIVATPGVLANDFDANGDPLTAIKVTDPAHGSLTLNADGSFTYLPAVNYVGSDSFTYKANDGAADSNVTTVTLTVVPPPVVTALQVFIEPAGAIAAGAMWRIQGETTYNPSGFVETGLTSGPAVVEFTAVDGWLAPDNQNVAILTDQTVVVTGTYTAIAPGTGALRVTIDPAGAIAAGAQWRRVGTTTYLDSAAVKLGVTSGTYAIEFKPISGWTAPANLTGLVVLTGRTTLGNGIYTIIPPGTPANYKITYKGCAIVAVSGNRGLSVTGANAAIIKIQKLKTLPRNHNDVAGKVLFLLDSPGIDFLNATGTIKTLTGIGAFIGTINADVTGSIKMGVVDTAVAAPATSIFATSAILPTAKTLKVSLTGVSLKDLVTNPSSAAAVAIRISAKKVKGATVPAGVTAGAQILVGNGLSLDVIGGNIYADLIESQGGIKSLTVKNLGDLMGGNLGQTPATSATLATTLETLGDFLTPAALAVVQHPSTPVVVSGLHNGPSLATDGIGKIFASTVHGVFVVGADFAGDLIAPRCDAAVKKWKATNSSGDAFVITPAKTQPAGIVSHTTAP